RPCMLHIDLGQHGKTLVEEALVLTPDRFTARIRLAERRAEMHVLPHQYAPVRGEAHGDAGKGIGGRQPPWRDFANGLVFVVGKLAAQAGMGGEVEELSPEKTELLAKAIDRQDHDRRLNAALCRRDVDALAV